ncbi:MAG: hypothetical protein N4A49_11495 [Marinifilaceae bacterium]|jgi:hypothetical protein|nr:hypothetical protein [Marinifilaceae bacterium]
MKLIRKSRMLILSVLMPAMILLAGNAVFNWHVHRLDDGSMIVHSHPYHKDTPNQHKHHDSKECVSIKNITSFISLAAISYVFMFTAKLVMGTVIEKKAKLVYLLNRLSLFNRPPPILCV